MRLRHFLTMLIAWSTITATAQAACDLTGVQSISGTTVNTGTYASGSVTSVSLTITFTKTGNGLCRPRIAFKGTLATPQMQNGASSTLDYSIPEYYTGATPGSALSVNQTANNQPTLTVTMTTTLTVPGGQSGQTNGLHSDNTVLVTAFDNGTPLPPTGFSLLVLGTVANPTSCTIGGSANGGTQTLDFSNGSTILTAQQFAAFSAVSCNAPATIELMSSGGAAKNAATATASHTNFFNYTATTTINGTTSTLNTATNPGTVGPETAAASITAATTTGAPLSIGVTPQLPAQPLVVGTFADVLTLTITPN